MTHYKEDEELAEHLREDSGYQSFKQTKVSSESSSPPSTGRSSISEHFTHTEVKTTPLINPTHPIILNSAVGMAHDIVENQTFTASAARVSNSEHSHEIHENAEMREQRLKDEAKFREKQDEIARKHEKHQEKVRHF
nr:CAHS 5a [Acutuncus antarcticus]